MPAFDNWTKSILLESLNNPLYEDTIDYYGSSTPDPFRPDSSLNNAGVGLCGYADIGPLDATPEQILYGQRDQMPSGADMVSQATWANYKNIVDTVMDSIGLSGSSINLGPFGIKPGQVLAGALYPIKQAIKTRLAQEYLGDVPDTMVSAGTLSDKEMEYLMNNQIKGQLKDFSKNTGLGRFGRFGMEIAKQLPKLAAMGYDPLDWATKMFGADSASKAYADLATNPRRSALGAGGYLAKGSAKGIY